MAKKRHTSEQIIRELREAEIELARAGFLLAKSYQELARGLVIQVAGLRSLLGSPGLIGVSRSHDISLPL